MKYLLNGLMVTLSALLVFSCTKVVDYDLAPIKERVVIEARIIKDSFALVRVTKTAPYLPNASTPVIKDAFIVISNKIGEKDTLLYKGNGYYKGDNIIGVVDDIYGLVVKAEGKSYTAYTTLPDAVPFQITGKNYSDGKSTFKAKGYYPTIKSTLPPDAYFLFNYYKNDSLYRKQKSDVNVTDSKFIGTVIDGLETPYPYQVNDVAKINIYRITKEAYTFYNDLGAQLTNDGGFFSTPPANTSTNFTNGAIGVFLGGALYTQSVIITP